MDKQHDIKNKKKEIIKMLYELEKSSIESTNMLNEQTEILDHSIVVVNETNKKLHVVKKIVKKIAGIFSKSSHFSHTDNDLIPENNKIEDVIINSKILEDDEYNEINEILENIKCQSCDRNTIINHQNTLIEDTTNRTQIVKNNIDSLIIDIKKI
jgi:hypothetical protein